MAEKNGILYIYTYIHMYIMSHNFFIHSSVNGHLGCAAKTGLFESEFSSFLDYVRHDYFKGG